ncbi:MAG TPA: acyl-CoA thioesterase [Holophaga sp.]|nr:acyl-CoA thioesterase [Holophaga sp.]
MEIRIDWSELDSIGHVNHLAIMKYVQAARVNYLERIGMMPFCAASGGIGPIMASTSCQFKKELHYPGQVVVMSKAGHLKNTSFQMKHVILNERQEVAAEAHDVIVMFDFKKRAKLPIPEQYRRKIEALEGLDGSAPAPGGPC